MMHKSVKINGQEYELQISARKIINGGNTAVSVDDKDTAALLDNIAEDLSAALEAINYAVESRQYEACYESDVESKHEMECCVNDWVSLKDRLSALLSGE